MATYNSCQFIGHLGNDPDYSITSNGASLAKFSLAVEQGKDQLPMWLSVVTWGKLAEIVEKHATKGAQIFVQGRLQIRQYEDKTGTKRQAVDLVAATVQLLDKQTHASIGAGSDDEAPFVNDLPA